MNTAKFMMELLFLFTIMLLHICQKGDGQFATNSGYRTVGGLKKKDFDLIGGGNRDGQQKLDDRVKVKKQPKDEKKKKKKTTAKPKPRLTTGLTMSVKHYCDNFALYCLRSYQTGRLCARTSYYNYMTMRNYCMMDYINCCEMYEVWQIVHMGECFSLKLNDELIPLYEYNCQKHVTFKQSRPKATLANRPFFTPGPGQAGKDPYAHLPDFKSKPNLTTLHPFLRSTTKIIYYRSLPDYISTHDYCDYIAVLCLQAHKTGRICAKTLYYNYLTFQNYCNLEYVNCMEGVDLWQIVHTGDCYYMKDLGREYMHYGYVDDFHLDQYYVLDDW